MTLFPQVFLRLAVAHAELKTITKRLEDNQALQRPFDIHTSETEPAAGV